MVARSSPKTEQALDKLSDLRARIKAARLEKLIARQMEEDVQLAPLELNEDALPQPEVVTEAPAETAAAPSSQDTLLEALAKELVIDPAGLEEPQSLFETETAPVQVAEEPAPEPVPETPATMDDSTTVAAAMERLVKRDETIKELKSELEQKNQTIDDLELELSKATATPEPVDEAQPAINIGELAKLQRAQAEKFEEVQQRNASLELKLAQHQNRLEIAAEEKQIAETRQDSLATRAHELECELNKLRKLQLSIAEEQERKDRTIAALEAKVSELSSVKLALEKHIINLRHIQLSEADDNQAATE